MTKLRELRDQVPWRPTFIDEAPIFAPLSPHASWFETLDHFPSPEEIDAALGARAGVSFVRAGPPRRHARREEDLYDASIHVRREVPTRDGSWHDLLNALIWGLFPKSKWALHARQHELVARGLDRETGRLPGARTREQDALALFDEGGLVVATPEPLETGEAIEHAVSQDRAWAVVFGHAIHEGFVLGLPWPNVRAVVLSSANFRVSGRIEADVDRELAERLADRSSFCDPSSLPRVRLAQLDSLGVAFGAPAQMAPVGRT